MENRLYPEAVLINTSGGLTGGDVMSYAATVEEGARLTVTGQAAEKIYKSLGDEVLVTADLEVLAGGFLEWMPQETILFNQSHLIRRNKVHLHPDAFFLGLEANVFGRTAYGEVVRDITLSDGWEIYEQGRLIWFDRFKVDGDAEALFKKPTLLDGAIAAGTVIIYGTDVESYIETLRDLSLEMDSRIGVTALESNLVIARVMNKDAAIFRNNLIRLLQKVRELKTGAEVPLPTVWKV
ncbi:urease accessory protein UreD [Sneathiella sp. P13V-1]|uniref:urease accessory protein UreD n=1 Tax=Sneathiella sp. P13V-1 TaxID=2697366 RepID=UPI00187B2B40|nr:urease accessory protein UreD [Sneathiella sp. P13V-1]MBE7635344.1 urease accessory protein UreD [Sneathiella sp. P13V-1]